MKKFIIACMVIVLSLSMVSCTKGEDIIKEDKFKKEERQKQTKDSEDLVKSYLELSMQGEFNESIKMVDEVSTTKKIFSFDNNIKLLGYKIKASEKLGSSMEVAVDVITCDKKSPYYSINNIKYTVNKKSENDKMLITNAEEKAGLVFFKDIVEGEAAFMIREGKKTNSKPVFTVKDLPSYISIKTNYLQEEKVKVGDSDLGAVAISGNGNQMIISSFEKGDTLLLILEKSLNVFSSEGLSAQKKAKDESEAQVEGLDYFKSSSVEYIAYSPSGEVIYTQIKSGDKVGLSLYSASSKQIISKNIMEKFNSPEYTIKNAYFNDDNSLILQVESIKEKKLENYVLDVLNDKIAKQDQ